MSEYKFVQWGKGIPVDYQRLGQMVSNEQYLKDKIDPLPKGVLCWKQISGYNLNPSGVYQTISTLTNIPFDVEDERLLVFEFNSGVVVADLACNYRIGCLIDSTNYSDISGNSISASNLPSSSVSKLVLPEALSKGSHTVTVQIIADAGSASLTIGGNSTKATLTITDVGTYISASS